MQYLGREGITDQRSIGRVALKRLDITLVIFRPDLRALEATLRDLASARLPRMRIWVLVSGSRAEATNVGALFDELGLADFSVISHRYDNLGFAGGHNFLLEAAFSDGADFVVVYNPDIECASDSLGLLLEEAQSHPSSLIGPNLSRRVSGGALEVDSLGIEWSRSGRHFDSQSGGQVPSTFGARSVQGLTGAVLVIPEVVFRRVLSVFGEFFDELFVAYREDAELGVRVAALGVPSTLVYVPGFVHDRTITRGSRVNPLVNRLSVQNRFFMRLKLSNYPGGRFSTVFRDALVVGACMTVERSSWPGVISAWRLRRYYWYKRRFCP